MSSWHTGRLEPLVTILHTTMTTTQHRIVSEQSQSIHPALVLGLLHNKQWASEITQ